MSIKEEVYQCVDELVKIKDKLRKDNYNLVLKETLFYLENRVSPFEEVRDVLQTYREMYMNEWEAIHEVGNNLCRFTTMYEVKHFVLDVKLKGSDFYRIDNDNDKII